MTERVAQWAVRAQGTKEFLLVHLVWWVIWKLLDLPIDVLTLWVSLEAIVQTCLVAMGQRTLTDHVRAQDTTCTTCGGTDGR